MSLYCSCKSTEFEQNMKRVQFVHLYFRWPIRTDEVREVCRVAVLRLWSVVRLVVIWLVGWLL